MRVFAAALLAAMILYYVPERESSLAVMATTEALSVRTVAEGETEWSIDGLTACLRDTGDLPETNRAPVASCEAPLYAGVVIEEEVTLRWPDDYVLEFRIVEGGALEVFATFPDTAEPVRLNDDYPVTSGSLLRIAADSARPILPLRGFLSIGQVPVRTDQLVLTGGRYEIRQKLRKSESTAPVTKGEFFPGDRIEFACEQPPFPIWPFVTRCTGERDVIARAFVTDRDVGDRTFEVVATTNPEYSSLRLTRVGGQPGTIPVRWTDRVLSDARPVAVATILGLIATIIALSNAYLSKPPEDETAGKSE